MHILIVADGRSPITRRWISGLVKLRYRVTLVSTYPASPVTGVSAQYALPVAFAGLAGSQVGKSPQQPAVEKSASKKGAVARFRNLFLSLRYNIGPLTLPYYGAHLRAIIEDEKPDLVHALRIPFEGMLAAYTPPAIPLAVSVWGNDLTFHSRGSTLMQKRTQAVLKRADALLADARRDIRLGRLWGFPEGKPSLVIPGSGGVDLDLMERLMLAESQTVGSLIRQNVPLVINPRGFRPGSVRNDVFFSAIPLVLDRMPRAHFICVAMAGQPEAMQWIRQLKLDERVMLTPFLTQGQLWNLFKLASVTVSFSSHDGTPNSLLEGMACGCFPVVGDIESLREWITPGVNGLVVEPDSPRSLATAILAGLENADARIQAAEINAQIIQERAEAGRLRDGLHEFYSQLLG